MTPERLAAIIAPVMRETFAALEARLKGELERLVAAIPAGSLGPPGAPGKDGADGRDGIGIDDVRVEYDGERLLTLSVLTGGRVKSFPITLPIPLDRGGWSATRTYTKGDFVTYRGHAWICQHAITAGAKPAEGGAWRLAVQGAKKTQPRDPDNGGTAHA